MNRRLLLLASLFALLVVVLGTSSAALSPASAANLLTGYYNLMGYEGVGTLGSHLTSHGQDPPIGDYVTTQCRYINVPNTVVGDYYLRYPLHLPNGVNITKVSLFVADFNPSGVLYAYLRSRPWNSRLEGSTLGFSLTNNTSDSDKTINIAAALNVDVDNETTEYWIDVSPENSADPGQLCVYGIQVTYTFDGALLPMIQKNY